MAVSLNKISHSPQYRGIFFKIFAQLCDAIRFFHACQYCVSPITLKPWIFGLFCKKQSYLKGEILNSHQNLTWQAHKIVKSQTSRPLAVRATALTMIQLMEENNVATLKPQWVKFWLRQS